MKENKGRGTLNFHDERKAKRKLDGKILSFLRVHLTSYWNFQLFSLLSPKDLSSTFLWNRFFSLSLETMPWFLPQTQTI
jgi:hypothetical protein